VALDPRTQGATLLRGQGIIQERGSPGQAQTGVGAALYRDGTSEMGGQRKELSKSPTEVSRKREGGIKEAKTSALTEGASIEPL